MLNQHSNIWKIQHILTSTWVECKYKMLFTVNPYKIEENNEL